MDEGGSMKDESFGFHRWFTSYFRLHRSYLPFEAA
jgi:hypothetical protein